MSDAEKPSPVETIKGESNYLRGELTKELVSDEEKFGKAGVQLLKHFGTYQQDNRDLRTQMRQQGKDKSYMFMVRTRIPGGRLTSAQLLAELDLCDELGNQTLRITTRQGLQLHGILKSNLHATIARIDEAQLTTLGACGDVNRNVMCCPAPRQDQVHESIQNLAEQLAEHLRPRTPAYHEIWLKEPGSEEKTLVAGGPPADDVEPIYGRHYLPRKFKIGIALPHDNCIDVYTHDVGLIALSDNGHLKGFNVLVGGGFGVTPSAKKTFPALGKRMCFVTCEQVIDVVTAIVKVQRDFGNRSDRKVARLKYLVANWGIERFKEKVEEYYGRPLPPLTDDDVHDVDDHLGWSEQGDGRLFYGLNVENGRLRDTGDFRLKSAIREVCRSLRPGIRLTAHQSLIFADIEPDDKTALEEMLRGHGVPLSQDISAVRRWSMACVAWPTCGLSITEAERALPGMVDCLQAELAKLGLAEEQFTLRMTGCPNGCARPYNSDIGLVGKAKGKYTLFLGGRKLGNRLNFMYKDLVPEEEVVAELIPLFTYFKQAREPTEPFGDFCYRKGKEDLLDWSERFMNRRNG